jgi:predicted transcriptional regulator YdeE
MVHGDQWFMAINRCLKLVTCLAGPYHSLPSAYAAIFPRIVQLPGYRVVGLPAIEVYHTARINVAYDMNHTDIYLPVVPRQS